MSTTQSSGKIVGKGILGEEGKTVTIEYNFEPEIKIARLMIVKTVKTDLCANTGAFAFLFINGQEVSNGSITELNSSIQAEAKPGDKIAVFATLYPQFNDIACVRLGNLNLNLIEIDFLG